MMKLQLVILAAMMACSAAFSVSLSSTATGSFLRTPIPCAKKEWRVAGAAMGLRRQRLTLRGANVAMQEVTWDKKSPEEAQALITDQDYTYVDVRTSEEFANAHPEGAVNVQAFAPTPDGPMPMVSTFVKLMETNFDKDAKLVIGCQSGKRSTAACMWLSQAGYSNLVEVETGFSGWSGAGLPVE